MSFFLYSYKVVYFSLFSTFRDALLFMHTTSLTGISFFPPISLIVDKDIYTWDIIKHLSSSDTVSYRNASMTTFLNGVTPQGLFGCSGSPIITSIPPGSHCILNCKGNNYSQYTCVKLVLRGQQVWKPQGLTLEPLYIPLPEAILEPVHIPQNNHPINGQKKINH